MKNNIFYLARKSWLIVLGVSILMAGSACNRSKCPANNGGYIDSHKMVSKQKHRKPKTGLFPKGEKRHGI
jgi:hypothetical protein